MEVFLNSLPQITPDLCRTSNNPGDGTASVRLRGLGRGRTLVLLNGRRLAPSSTGSSIDVNSIPGALIESVEIVSGGAFAVFGSDAVAGAVNFITRKDFTGVELDAAEAHLKRAPAINEKAYGPTHAQTQQKMLQLAAIFKTNGKEAEAAELEKRVQDLRAPNP